MTTTIADRLAAGDATPIATQAIAALTAVGATPRTIAAAKLLLARGRILQAELEALETLDPADRDQDDLALLQCLDGLAHLIADGVPLTPLVNQITQDVPHPPLTKPAEKRVDA